MRLQSLTTLLVFALVSACSADRTMPTASPSVPISAQRFDLGLTGPSPLRASRALGINDSGTVVGDASLTGDVMKAVVWRPPTYEFAYLPDLVPQGSSVANAIAEDGTIGGRACDDIGACHPVFWRGGTLHVLDGVGQVNAICPCDSHTKVGDVIVNGIEHGALWVDGVLIDVGTPAGFANAKLVSVAHGYIVGNAFNDSLEFPGIPVLGWHPYRWSPTSGWSVLEGYGPVNDVNSSGTAVGEIAHLWLNGSNVRTLIANGDESTAINDSGVVAGLAPGSQSFETPAVWSASSGWTTIGDDFFATMTAISNTGHVVGYTGHDNPQAILFR